MQSSNAAASTCPTVAAFILSVDDKTFFISWPYASTYVSSMTYKSLLKIALASTKSKNSALVALCTDKSAGVGSLPIVTLLTFAVMALIAPEIV